MVFYHDSELLAKATLWAATNPQCENSAFNIINGDLFRWSYMWPKIAAYFQMEAAPPLPMNLQIVMADKELLWKEIQLKYGLSQVSYNQISSWAFGDAVFGWDYDFFSDGTKARRLGFSEFVDTEQRFYELFNQLRANKIIPIEQL